MLLHVHAINREKSTKESDFNYKSKNSRKGYPPLKFMPFCLQYFGKMAVTFFECRFRGKNLKKISDMYFQKIRRIKKDSDLQRHCKKSYSHFLEIFQAKEHLDYLNGGYPLKKKKKIC